MQMELPLGRAPIFVGFVLKTKPGGKESVNCELTGKEANDIHIVLANSPDDPECSSVTAEMIPHFRPVSQIAFTAALPGRPWKVHLVSAEGGTPQQLMPDERHEFDPGWSSDGNMLVFDVRNLAASTSALVVGWPLHGGDTRLPTA
jgi:hypothetical protein